MTPKAARELGEELRQQLEAGETRPALARLLPHLSKKIRFAVLDKIGEVVAAGSFTRSRIFLENLAAAKTMGAWPVLGTALKVWSEKHLSECLELCRIGSIAGDLWYATDILGERVPGPALVCDFDQTLAILKTWRSDPNPWVRRSIGVGIHVWTKRSQGKKEFSARAGEILSFLEPLFGEREIDAVKGIGWSLKTLGRFYPDLAFPWLRRMLTSHPSGFRPLMVRKAVTYFSPAQKKEIARIASGSEGPF